MKEKEPKKEKMKDPNRKKKITTTICSLVLLLLTLGIGFVGYKVVVTSGEVPGRLTSVAAVVQAHSYQSATIGEVQKISYEKMKYGYMDDVMLAQMDYMDSTYQSERLEELRQRNNKTVMEEWSKDKENYEIELAQREKEEKARIAAEEEAERARIALIQKQIAEKEAQENAIQTSFVFTGDSSNLGSGATASNGGAIGQPVYADHQGESLGVFNITAYCTCRVCCGVYSGGNRTSSGTVPTSNHTLAVDTDVIAFGTRLVINGQVYVAEDRGGAIKGRRIDMFFYTHQEALAWGRRDVEVFLYE